MKFNKHVLFTALATSLCLPAIAEEQSPIIVTATRTAQTADESLASVTVITKEDIDQLQPNNIQDLLTALAGIDITNQGGNGKITSMFLRGTSSSHVLVMIDGIKIGSATSGTSAFEHIPVSQIDHIEIVRGPRSSLYGSEAIGGVIQIFTHKGTEQELAHFGIKYGSYNTRNISAGLSGKSGDTSYALTANNFESNGFNAVNDTEADNDGYNSDSVTLNASHDFNKSSSLAFNFMQADGHVEYDGTSQNNSDIVQQTAGIKLTFNPLEFWNVILSRSESQDKNDSFLNSTYKSTFNTKKTITSWQNDLVFSSSQILTFGFDNQNDSIQSSTNFAKNSRNNAAGFIQHQWNGDSNDIQISLRNDDNEAFGSHTTGGLSWGHNFENDLRLIASYGTAFKSPTFNNLYYPGGGNSDLKPEESVSKELELRQKHTGGKWSLSVYNTTIDNLIAGWPTKNVNKAEINGIDFHLNKKIFGWDTKLDLSLLDPRDKTTNKVLQRRSQELLRFNIDKKMGKWKNGIGIVSQGHRYNDTTNATRIDGYTIMNIQAQYMISKKVTLKGKVDNIFDKKYATALDFSKNTYNNPGRSVYISLQYQDF